MMKSKRLPKRSRLSLFAIVTVIGILMFLGVNHLSGGFPIFYIGLWLSGFALCMAPVAFFALPILALWDLITMTAADKKKRTPKENLMANYILGDDGEIIEVVDDDTRKRDAKSQE